MKRLFVLMLIVFVAVGVSCSRAQKAGDDTYVLIKTELGDIKLKLYNDTPEHKKNFIKLADEGYYNGVLFHRVINEFMIQGGDATSINAEPGARLGSGNPGYTIPAEFNSKYFHKKGALAAARKGGSSNPEKRSSGSQFYIVQGKVFSPGRLDTMEMTLNSRAKNDFYKAQFQAANNQLNEFRKNNDQVGFNECVAELREKTDSMWEQHEKVVYSPEQREAYTTVGGYPSLDGEYTVFGEVVEGLDVLDKIAAVETDQFDRPQSDIKMEVELVK
uniref:peptidylprolyl isomerase n=1 Tax=uncultured Draconibacterium sp. TaxID=1573823 RepID=UPI003216F9E3